MPLCLMLDAVLADLVGDESGERFAAHVRRYAAWVGTELGVAGRPGEVQPAALAHGWWNLCEDGDGTIRPLAPVQAAAGGASVSLTFAVWRMLKGFAARNRGELPGLWKGMRP